VQLLFATGKSFTVDGLREKLREFFRQEVRPELRVVAALNNVELIWGFLHNAPKRFNPGFEARLPGQRHDSFFP
jgi:hypothetical protein